MAFLASQNENHYFHLNRYIGGNNGLAEHIYITTDPIGTVTAAGYFTDWRGPLPRSGDVLRILEVVDRDDLSSIVAVHNYVVIEWNVSYAQIDPTGWRRNADGESYSLVLPNGFELLTAYVAGDEGRLEFPTTGYETVAKSNYAAIGVQIDVARPKWNAGTGLNVKEGSDPGELNFWHKFNEFYEVETEAVAGLEAVKGGDNGFVTWLPAALLADANAAFGSNATLDYRNIRPVEVSGSPTFTGTRWFAQSGVSGPVDGEIIHIRSDESSGTGPTLSLSGETAKKLLRNAGTVPAVDYWTGPWVGSFTYDAAADGAAGAWIARTAALENSTGAAGTGTDAGGAGRTTGPTRPFYGRQARISANYVSAPTAQSTAGMLVASATRHLETVERPRLIIGPGPGITSLGRSSHESRSTFGYNGVEYYPGALDDPDPPDSPLDRTSIWADGPRTPLNTGVWANYGATACDFTEGVALSIRHEDNMLVGLDIGADLANNTTVIQATTVGTSPVDIASQENGFDTGLTLVTTSVPHGFVSGDWVVGTNTGGGGYYDHDYCVEVISPTKFLLLGSRYSGVGSAGEFTKQDKTTVMTIGADGVQGIKFPATAVPSADANTLDDYQESTWTVVLTFSTTQPTDLTYGTRAAQYTVIGNRVFFNLRLTLTSKGTGGVGNIRVSLPVALASGQEIPFATSFSTMNATGVAYTAQGINGQAYAQLYEHADNASLSNLTWNQLTDTTTIWLSGHYRV